MTPGAGVTAERRQHVGVVMAGLMLVLLLASPLSSWTTGQVISVNGGYARV